MADEVSQAEQTGDEFDKSFAEFAATSEGASKKPEEGEGGEPTDKGVGKEEEGKTEEGKEKKGEQDKGTEGKAEEKKAETVSKQEFDSLQQQYRSLQGMFNKLDKQMKDGAKKEAEKETGEKEKGKQEPPLPSFEDFFGKLYDDLDDLTKKNIKAYEDEFDLPAKAEDTKRNHALKKAMKYMQENNKAMITEALKVFATSVQKYLDPFVKSVDDNTISAHYTAVKNVHPDFETYRDDGSLKAWIDEQPKVLRTAYIKAYEQGDTEDVIDLYNAFKAAKGIGKKTEAKEEKQEEEDKSKESRVRNLEQVKSKSTGVNIDSGGKSASFDDAFEEEIKKRAGGRR